jgi:ABC-type branched-subunit amino acid transport system permease subunit
MGVALFVQANTTLFNGYEGIRGVVGPEVLGRPFRDPLVFHAAALTVAAACYLSVIWLLGTPFGLALQGLRDAPRRLLSLGYNGALHRIAAFGVAGFVAGAGGVLATFYNIGISPGSIGLGATVNILVMAVIGGLGHPVGRLPRRTALRAARYLRGRHLRPRALQHPDRPRLPRHRRALARRRARADRPGPRRACARRWG